MAAQALPASATQFNTKPCTRNSQTLMSSQGMGRGPNWVGMDLGSSVSAARASLRCLCKDQSLGLCVPVEKGLSAGLLLPAKPRAGERSTAGAGESGTCLGWSS